MFHVVREFEREISDFFGSPYAIATDSCTHALELCLRYEGYTKITIPTRTYISVPFTAMKLGLEWEWRNEDWKDYYYIGNTSIVDAAVLWENNSYIPGTYMCVSFQFKKHLNLGRGGIILLDNRRAYDALSKMVYDGRSDDAPWANQDISTIGYHYYMTPETAQLGLNKLKQCKDTIPERWDQSNYPYLPSMSVFK